jgi:hypothetical protein
MAMNGRLSLLKLIKITANMRHAMLLGRLANGCESDHGSLVHAVVNKDIKHPKAGQKLPSGYICPERYATEVSLCGKIPGRRSVGWSTGDNALAVTCIRCLKKLIKIVSA